MLKLLQKWIPHPFLFSQQIPFSSCNNPSVYTPNAHIYTFSNSRQKILAKTASVKLCHARRRVIYDDEDDDEYGYNEEIAILENYSQLMRDEVLVVHAMVDEEEVEVLIFKGFSSCLSYETYSDPSRSVLPAKAVIKSVDRVKGPFDPSNIQYIEKGLSFDAFKSRLTSQN